MTLSEMMKIIGKSESMRAKFGFSSRNRFDSGLGGGVIKLRNKVMHPTRTLIQDDSDLLKLVERLERIEEALRNYGVAFRRSYEEPYSTDILPSAGSVDN
jgi:hypothetical protein